MIQPSRVKYLNTNEIQSNPFVIYWMQSSQRSEYNHALEYAIEQSNSLNKPLLVVFFLDRQITIDNERHFYFLLQGLQQVKISLAKRGIRFVVVKSRPDMGALSIADYCALMVVDRGYLKEEVAWRESVAKQCACPLIQVESDVIVPVEEASPKEEYSAATFRRRINKRLYEFILPLHERIAVNGSININIPFVEYSIEDVDKVLKELQVSREVKKSPLYNGGTENAKKYLDFFISVNLSRYENLKNNPAEEVTSNLSAYLRYGQISPLQIYMLMMDEISEGKRKFLDELIIRRELSINFVHYNPNYASFESLPSWARKTLEKHQRDIRYHIYNLDTLEKGNTHDEYWNAAQQELVKTGKMHNYMRMYWGKKLIEWSDKPEDAFYHAQLLNNKYSLDGGSANSYAGIAWCFGKHDRPWQEREIFGNVRYMNAAGLKRKFPINQYVQRIFQLNFHYK